MKVTNSTTYLVEGIKYRDMNWLGQAGPLLSGISAVDIALWDMKGRVLGVPVYELLGGAYRRKIQLYANCWYGEDLAANGSLMLHLGGGTRASRAAEPGARARRTWPPSCGVARGFAR